MDVYDSLDDCFAELPFKILFGTTRGSMVHTLRLSIEKIFVPAAEYQMRVPQIDSAEREDEVDEDEVKAPTKPDDVDKMVYERRFGANLMDFSRPSDFRLIAVKAKRAG